MVPRTAPLIWRMRAETPFSVDADDPVRDAGFREDFQRPVERDLVDPFQSGDCGQILLRQRRPGAEKRPQDGFPYGSPPHSGLPEQRRGAFFRIVHGREPHAQDG